MTTFPAAVKMLNKKRKVNIAADLCRGSATRLGQEKFSLQARQAGEVRGPEHPQGSCPTRPPGRAASGRVRPRPASSGEPRPHRPRTGCEGQRIAGNNTR